MQNNRLLEQMKFTKKSIKDATNYRHPHHTERRQWLGGIVAWVVRSEKWQKPKLKAQLSISLLIITTLSTLTQTHKDTKPLVRYTREKPQLAPLTQGTSKQNLKHGCQPKTNK